MFYLLNRETIKPHKRAYYSGNLNKRKMYHNIGQEDVCLKVPTLSESTYDFKILTNTLFL